MEVLNCLKFESSYTFDIVIYVIDIFFIFVYC